METESQIPWREYAETIARSKRWIVAVFLCGSIAAAAWTWSQPPTYSASAKIRVSSRRANIRIGADGDANAAFEPVTEANLMSEVALLKSSPLVREVLARHWQGPEESVPQEASSGLVDRAMDTIKDLPALPRKLYGQLHGLPARDPFEGWVSGMLASLNVRPLRKSNLIEVSVAHSKPEWTAQFVNELVDRHVERHAELNRAAPLRFFESQRENLRQKMEAAQAELRAFSDREGIESVAEQRSQLKSRLADAQGALTQAETEIAEQNARLTFLLGQTSKARPPLGSGSANGEEQMRDRIVALELDRSRLLGIYAPESIKIRDLEQQIASAKELLSSAGGTDALAPPTADGPVELEIVETRASLSAISARVTALQHLAEGYRQQLEHTERIAAEADRIEHDASTARDRYRQYVQNVDEAQLAMSLDELGILNITVVEHAAVPSTPQNASQTVLTLGILGSLALGIAAAFVRAWIDPVLRSSEEIQRVAGVPVLAEIPD